MLNVIMLNVIMLRVIMLSVILLSIVMLSVRSSLYRVILLNVIMLNVVIPLKVNDTFVATKNFHLSHRDNCLNIETEQTCTIKVMHGQYLFAWV
jgi:hypothetical protein